MLPQHVFQHIQEKCNLEPIKDVLRYIKESVPAASKDIVLGTTKEEAINNLSRAVSLNYCTQEEVFDLLRDAEECGHQHILLLTPAFDVESPVELDFQAVAGRLFDHPIEDIFPRFEYPSSGYGWADFRRTGVGEPLGWIAKAYGLESVKISLGVTTESLGGNRVQEIREYDFKEVKTTSIARWRPDINLFEFRIDSSALQNADVLPRRRDAMWHIFSNAFSKEQFVGVDIDNLLHNLLFSRLDEDNTEIYSVSRVELTDPRSGLIRVVPFNSEAFDMEPGRKQSLEAMEAAKFQPSLIRVEWKATAPGVPRTMTESVPTVLQKTENGPELRILKRVTCEVYEYVFNQLRNRL